MKENKQQRRKFSAAEISAVLKRYRQSGKSRREFCDLEGISYHRLCNWLRAEKKPGKRPRPKNASSFIALDITPAARSVMQLALPGGRLLSFFTQPDVELIKQLLA
jgi:transposase-like protein